MSKLAFGQSFVRGQRVKVADEMPPWMRHFPCGCEAIIDHSYRDMHGPSNSEQYALVLLLPDGPRYTAWYPKELLTLVSEDRDAGEMLLQEYNGNFPLP